MGMAMSNALALARWHGFRFLDDGITQEDIAWLLIGVVLAAVVIWIYQRRRRRWF
jgi:LPXTG-motif cell wall-anchored protein